MPTDEQGNILYEDMDADSAWDRLVAESGDDVDIATMVAQSNIEDAQKALDKAKKQTPKLVGTTEEKLATAKAFKESVVKAQNDLAKWQEIADVPKRRASLQGSQENSNFVEQQNNTQNGTERTERISETEHEEQRGSSEEMARGNRQKDMSGKANADSGRRGRLVVDGNTREERVNNAVAKGVEATQYAYGEDFTLYDVTPEGVCVYIDQNGNEACFIAMNESQSAFVAVFRDDTGKWTSKMQNKTGERELSRGMMRDVMSALPKGVELVEHTNVSVDGMRVLANQLKHGWGLNGKTYTCGLNAADINSVLGVTDNGNYDSISWDVNDIEGLRDILQPYMEALGMTRADVNIDAQGKVELTLPVLEKGKNKQIQPTTQEQNEQAQQEQTELQGQQVTGKLPASEEVGPTETTPVEEVAQEKSVPIEEQTKGNVSTMSQETDQVSEKVEEEKDVVEELRERNRVGNERDQRAGRPPRPSDYIEAIGKGDDKAMKAWEGEFNDYAQKLNADDLPDIESTIRQMQGHIDTIRSGNPKGYKDNSAYKAYSGIKKMLEKRRRELNKQSAEDNTRLSAMSGVGLVEDARTRTLGDKTRKMLDAMAKRLGLQVEFVDEIVTGKDEKGNNTYANADIVGNKVRIAWDKRDQALDFLLGHEFTHRMQALSSEAYAEFVEATKQALGEKEWNKRINRMKSLYKQHGIAISEQGIIDEVVADYAGKLVEERGVFDNFVERNKDNRSLLSKIADVLRSIKEFFTLGKQRKINNAIARLEALIESASEANKNTQKSLIEEAKLQIKQKMSDLQKAETTIKGWVENKKRGKSFEIKLPTQTQRMVKRAMGKDYDSHNITANGIAHGFNNHGERGKKLGPNSIPVRKEDAGLIPYIMTAPDRVEKGSTDVRNRESVRFYKNLSNGYIVVVEKERINSSDDMETISFWIEMSSEATNAQRNVVPDINVRNAILSTDVAKIRKDAETAIEKDVENSVKAQYSLQGNSMTEEVESVLEDYTLNKDNVGDFEYALMQSIAGQSYSARPDYKVLDGVVVRVKGHTPDWDNFVNWETDKAESEKILNVTVGNYEDTDYRRNKEDYESFAEAHPETTAVNVDIEDGTSLADALSQIHEALKAKGIDFEFAPDYSWTKWSEYTPEARYSLASDMARDAVMTALEGAGIDVEMATPEMVEDVLRTRDAVQLSKRSEEREQTNRWIDEATAFVSGKSIKEVRQERIRKERERKELAKEIYENVLSGNFNEVTLQKINQYIDETTPRNPYGRRLSQRLPQRVEREMYENQRENAVDALYSRISESAVPANGRFSESGRREIESRKKEALKGWAIATGNWHTDLSAFTNQTEPIGVGTDSKVYVSKDGKHVIKASKGKPYGKRFRPDIDNIPLFNSVFKNSAYEIVGYGEIDGEFVRILKQPIVDFANSTPLTEDERVEYMRSLGFEPLNKENTAFSNGEIVVSDLQKSNIVKDVDGNIRVIDADAKLHTKDVGGNYEYLPVEYDLPSAEFLIAYHGSGAKFDEFDHSHMGEGEGAQAYGWGTYLTEVEGIAKMYAGASGATMLTYKGNELDTDGLLNPWRVIKDLYDENKGRLREMRNRAEHILNLVEEDNTEMKQLWQSVVDTLKQVRAGDLKVKPKRNLYTVEIPDDNGSNYLDYDEEMSKKELNEVRNKLEAILAEGDYKGVEKELKRELDSVFVDGLTASDVYGNVSAYLGGDKQASEFFNEMGYVGIKYPANYRSGGNEDGKKNFVIFNDSDMKITDRVEFLQTPDGTVYGWTIGGKIFLTEQGMNAETPIHEYTHLWANAMRRNNEQGWESVKDLLRGTPMWDEVLADKNYSNIHDNEDLVASEVLSRYSGKDNAKRLEDEAQRMISEAKGIGAKADAVSLIDRVRRALQKFWDWVGKDLFGIKEFDSIEQVTDRVLYDLMNQTDLNAEVSEGEGPFGKIYRQFKGKAKEAFDYLMKVKEGDALGVYNRKGIGDIDLVWGDKNGGLAHIISKHIGKGKSFANIEDAQNSISDIINNGGVIFENGDKVVISKNGKIVTLRKNFRVKGKKIADKNWILTAYNENAADNTSAISGINQGQAAPTTAISADKGNANSSDVQAKSGKGAKFSLQGGRSIADKYEKRVNTKGKGGALHLSKFNFMEAWQDEMRALKEVQRIIEQEYDIVLESYEDAYMAENAMSSIAKASWDRYINEVYEPMMRIHDEWIRSGESNESINHYLIAKSGLERNREFTVRDALAEMDKMDRQIINGAYSGTVLQLANALRQGQISQDEYNTQVQEAKDKKNQALENIKNAQQARVDAYRAERDALREQLKNGDITCEEFNQLSDEVAIRHAKVEEIKDYSGLTALAKQYNEKDWRNFAEQMVVNFENKHDNTDVLWERINNATKKAVEKSYESGITSKEAKNHLDQMFLWYVPMGGMENDTAEDIYSYLNRNADSAFTQTVKRAEGHSEHISDDVMAMIANTMQSAILQGNRNKMKQKFLNMVENYPTDLFSVDNGWVELQGNDWVEVFPDINENDTPEEVRSVLPHQFYNLQIFYILLIDYKTNNRSLIMPTLLPGCSRIYVQ